MQSSRSDIVDMVRNKFAAQKAMTHPGPTATKRKSSSSRALAPASCGHRCFRARRKIIADQFNKLIGIPAHGTAMNVFADEIAHQGKFTPRLKRLDGKFLRADVNLQPKIAAISRRVLQKLHSRIGFISKNQKRTMAA